MLNESDMADAGTREYIGWLLKNNQADIAKNVVWPVVRDLLSIQTIIY